MHYLTEAKTKRLRARLDKLMRNSTGDSIEGLRCSIPKKAKAGVPFKRKKSRKH
ncbi:MAG: hypothetical protein ACOX42_01030 [Clostridia bacterium]